MPRRFSQFTEYEFLRRLASAGGVRFDRGDRHGAGRRFFSTSISSGASSRVRKPATIPGRQRRSSGPRRLRRRTTTLPACCPTVYRGPYEFAVPGAPNDFVMQTEPEPAEVSQRRRAVMATMVTSTRPANTEAESVGGVQDPRSEWQRLAKRNGTMRVSRRSIPSANRYRIGMWVALASILMMFTALTQRVHRARRFVERLAAAGDAAHPVAEHGVDSGQQRHA